jgi:hypothetical protein
MCYELDYGSAQCKSWDVGKNPHCVPDPTGKTALPSWCTQPWCYVDRETCKRSPNALYLSNNIFARELYYSYDTCASNATRVNGLPVRLLARNHRETSSPYRPESIAPTMLCACRPHPPRSVPCVLGGLHDLILCASHSLRLGGCTDTNIPEFRWTRCHRIR